VQQDVRPVVIPEPSVTRVSPSQGPAGGATVTISGANLEHAIAVHFGSVVGKITRLVSADEIVAQAPPGSGRVSVTVTTPGGISALGAADEFTYFALPKVTEVSPGTGMADGGTSVVIKGENLVSPSAVHFGGAPGKILKIVSAEELEVMSPSGKGTVDVTVTTPGGTSTKTTSDHYAYASGTPSVTQVSPDNGNVNGGNTVTIVGSDLGSAESVHFGSAAAKIKSIVSDSEVHVTAPSGQGTVNVTVTSAGGTSAKSSNDRYSYSITSIVHPAEIRL
jgi:hypothetical protein